MAPDKPCATEQRAALQALPSAQSILRVQYLGISHQLPITCQQLKFFQADDLTIGTAMLNRLETMATGRADFLRRFPDVKAEGRE